MAIEASTVSASTTAILKLGMYVGLIFFPISVRRNRDVCLLDDTEKLENSKGPQEYPLSIKNVRRSVSPDNSYMWV